MNQGFGCVLPSMVLWLMPWLSGNSPATQCVVSLYSFVCTLCAAMSVVRSSLWFSPHLQLWPHANTSWPARWPTRQPMGPCLTALTATTGTTAQVGVRQVVSPVCAVVNDDSMRQTAKVNANIGTNLSTQRKREVEVCFPMTQFVQIKWAWLCDVLLTGLCLVLFYFFLCSLTTVVQRENQSALWSLCCVKACGKKVLPMCLFSSVCHNSWPTFF